MFLRYETTLLNPFILNGKKYTTNAYLFTITSISYQGCLGTLSNDNENILTSINLFNLDDLMQYGSFDKGVFSSKVVAVKEEDKVVLVPIDSEEFKELKERSLIPQKLEKGIFYSLFFNNNVVDNALYLGKLFLFEGTFNPTECFIKEELFCFRINNAFRCFSKRKSFIIAGINSTDKCLIDENFLTFIAESKCYLRNNGSISPYNSVFNLASFTDFGLKTAQDLKFIPKETKKTLKECYLKQQENIKKLKDMRAFQ